MDDSLEIMLDIETLSTSPRARIIQIGATKFHRYGGDSSYPEILDEFKVNVVSTTGDVDSKTLEWWDEQKSLSPGLHDALSIPEPIDLQMALSQYKKFCKGADHQWSNGVGFDCTIMDYHFSDQGMKPPFPFWRHRDTRTIWDMIDPESFFREKAKNIIEGDAHDALVDCYMQTYAVQCCFRKMRRWQQSSETRKTVKRRKSNE